MTVCSALSFKGLSLLLARFAILSMKAEGFRHVLSHRRTRLVFNSSAALEDFWKRNTCASRMYILPALPETFTDFSQQQLPDFELSESQKKSLIPYTNTGMQPLAV